MIYSIYSYMYFFLFRCYIGKHRLEKAIEIYKSKQPNVEFQLQYLPYQLDSTRTTTVNKLQHYKEKFGEDRVGDMQKRMKEVTGPLGININFGGVISNTFNSHRLIWWSSQFQKQPEVVEKLCELYFDENKDIGDLEALANAAEKAGLDKQKTLDFLKGTEGTNEVKSLVKENVYNEITGVPHYTFNEK